MRTIAGGGYTGAARTTYHDPEDAFMVPGMGAQPVPVKEWVPANDNEPSGWPMQDVPPPRGQYIGLTRTAAQAAKAAKAAVDKELAPLRRSIETSTGKWAFQRPGDPNGRADDLVVPVKSPAADYSPSPRKGDWLQTFTGKAFWPMDPRSQEVDIRDIAHALSMQCRYAGHCRRFYSVAEHSTLIARWLVGQARTGRAQPEAAIYGLLHDASEAYLVDVPRPVKPYLYGYADAENKVQAAIWAHFGLGPDVPPIVKEADDRILADELVNMTRMDWHARHADPLGVPMMYWSPAEAEREFLATFEALTGRVV